jgi:hypothetical protein
MKKGQKWQKVETTTFFEIKIDFQLRFDIKNDYDYDEK